MLNSEKKIAVGPRPLADFPRGADGVLDSQAILRTWIAWAAFFVAVCVTLFCMETGEPVNHAYACGAKSWLARQDLYDGGCGFIYLPQSAILYAPFHMLPYAAEHILWRMVTIGLFAVGVWRLSRFASDEGAAGFFPIVSVLVLPKTWTSAYSGQATLAMAGLLMIALAEVQKKNWSRAALLLVAALTFKPLAIVLILLVGAIYRPMLGRLALCLAAFFMAPYLVRDVLYVNAQYAAAVSMFDDAMKIGLQPRWAHLFSLGSLAGFEISESGQTAARIALALATLALCCRACWLDCGKSLGLDRPGLAPRKSKSDSWRESAPVPGLGPAPTLLVIYALAAVYLLLLNPRSENNSYVMLSPVLAVFCVRAYYVERRTARAACLAAGIFGLVAGHELCGWLTPDAGFIWISPLVALLFALDCALAVILPVRLSTAMQSDSQQGVQPASLSLPFATTVSSEIVDMVDAA